MLCVDLQLAWRLICGFTPRRFSMGGARSASAEHLARRDSIQLTHIRAELRNGQKTKREKIQKSVAIVFFL